MKWISFKGIRNKILMAQMEVDREAVKNIQRTAAHNERQRWAKRLRQILEEEDFHPSYYEPVLRGLAEALEENDLFYGGKPDVSSN